MPVKAYFVQYKFILPKETKHSSYTYQKLFRAIYGYTQNVSKGGGKAYKYHRKGVLSDVPYLRPGKNCVLIPPSAFNKLITFLKTGKNPTHFWKIKGDWKAVYYMDEKQLSENEVVSALENLASRLYVDSSEGSLKLSDFIALASDFPGKNPEAKAMEGLAAKEAEAVVNCEWFKEAYPSSGKLASFLENYKKLRQKPG